MDIEKSNVLEIYSKISDHFSSTRYSKWSWINNFIDLFEPNSNIWDIGCGNGRNMLYSNLNFIGVDNCKNFLDICQKNH